MNAPDLVSSFLVHAEVSVRSTGDGFEDKGGIKDGPGYAVLVLCVFLSAVTHSGAFLLLDLRPVDSGWKSPVLTVDLLDPAPSKVLPKPPQEPPDMKKKVESVAEPVKAAEASPPSPPEPGREPRVVKSRPVASTKAPEKKVGRSSKPPAASERKVASPPARPQATSASAKAPIGKLEERPGVTILANESGGDTLKHGAEARFMQGLATEEFVEENYIGEYSLPDSSRVWIEDDRSRSGHLILHAEAMGLHRKLYRFNRFIYVYGQSSDVPMPVLGSVTFFSDGYHIHQFMWQHNSTEAYYPRRN